MQGLKYLGLCVAMLALFGFAGCGGVDAVEPAAGASGEQPSSPSFVTDEQCAAYDAGKCPIEAGGCGISVGHRFDPARGCVDYNDATEPECRGADVDTNNVLAMDPQGGLWEFTPTNVRPRDWPEVHGPHEGFVPFGQNEACSE